MENLRQFDEENLTEPDAPPTRRGWFRFGKRGLAVGASLVSAASLANAEPPALGANPIHTKNIPTQAANNEAVAGETVQTSGSEDGAPTINGKKTIVIGVWQGGGQSGGEDLDPNLLDALDANTVLNASMQTAESLEGKAWVSMAPDLNPGPPLPNQIWNEQADELDGYGVTPDKEPAMPNNRLPNDQNFTMHLADGVDPSTIIHQGDYQKYLENLGPEAVVTDDYYPLNRSTLGARSIEYMYQYALRARAQVEEYTQGKAQTPFGGYIEANRIDVNSQQNPVTPELVQAEIKAYFTAGATIEKIWTWSWVTKPDGSADPNAVAPEIAAAIKEQNEQLQQYSYIFLAPRLESVVSGWGEPIKLGGHFTISENGKQTYYIIMFNSTPNTMTVQQKLPGLQNQQVKEVISGQLISGKNGNVTVTIPGFGWVIESYSPASNAAQTVHASKIHTKRPNKSHRT